MDVREKLEREIARKKKIVEDGQKENTTNKFI